MIQRLAAFIFIFAVAGQVLASTCICESAEPVHKCCIRKAEKNDYVSSRGCCGPENCAVQRSSNPAVRVCHAGISVAAETVLFLPTYPAFAFDTALDHDHAPHLLPSGYYRPYARPPDLYVRHHSFRI